jgi:hypothetical protein
MQLLLEQIFTVFDSTQASLIIYLLTSALLILGLMVNISFSSQTPAGISRRLAISLLIMLLVELAAFAATIVLSTNPQIGNAWLPPIDRFQMAFIIIWLMWIWAFPESSPWPDTLTAMLTLAASAAFIFTLSIWIPAAASNSFNAYWLDLGWQTSSLSFLVLMDIILSVRRKRLWGAGVLTGLLFICGHILQIIFPNLSASYSGPVRLATLIALPLLLILPHALTSAPSATHTAKLRRGRDKRDRRRFSTELPTALGFLSLAWEDNPQTAMEQLIKSIGRALVADICLFITQPNQNGQVSILAGHDFFNHVDIKETRLDRQRIPLIIDALAQNHGLRLPEDYSDTPDTAYLCRLVKYNGKAPLLVHPVSKPNAWQVGGILLLTPHNRRAWTEDDSRYVSGLAEALIRIIEHNQAQLESSNRTQKLIDEQQESGQIIINLQNELQELSTDVDKFQSRIAELETTNHSRQRIDTLVEVVAPPKPTQPQKEPIHDATIRLDPKVVEKHETEKEIKRLQEENDALRQLIAHISAGPEEMDGQLMNLTERELRLSLEEVARLKNILANADMKIRQLERKVQGGA